MSLSTCPKSIYDGQSFHHIKMNKDRQHSAFGGFIQQKKICNYLTIWIKYIPVDRLALAVRQRFLISRPAITSGHMRCRTAKVSK